MKRKGDGRTYSGRGEEHAPIVATLSVRVEVQVHCEDQDELDLIRRTYAKRCAQVCDTFMGKPTILHAGTVLRRT